MILLIDNYDSFSYNVYQLVGAVNSDIKVIRNDEMTLEEIEKLNPSHIILSPGPGKPCDAGICEAVVEKCKNVAGGTGFWSKVPVLGICLGHQAISEVFGATVTYAKELMHGKVSECAVDTNSLLFDGMDERFTVARYHSLAAEASTIPEELIVTALTADGEVMAVEHKTLPIFGVQFHPESVLTPLGYQIMTNFLKKEKKFELKYNKSIERITTETGKTAKEDKKLIETAIVKLSKKEDIGYEMAKEVMKEIMDGKATEVQKSSYLTALSMKGETVEEITGSAEEMRAHATQIHPKKEVLEIVGTGGDGSNSFNISTTASIVISAAGVPVAKHGNRAASSKSGAADCLEALGVKIDLTPEKNEELLEQADICFLFAQKYHSAMRFVGPIRKELGIRTIFNILGPLANPASATLQVMGVFAEELVEPMAHVLHNLGVRRGLVVYGQDKIDELTVSAPTSICEFDGDNYKTYAITSDQMGLGTYKKEELVGGTPAENAEITKAVLSGEKGARRDAVVLNAGAALYVAGKADSIEAGVRMAEEIIDSGKAMAQLEKFVKVSNDLAE